MKRKSLADSIDFGSLVNEFESKIERVSLEENCFSPQLIKSYKSNKKLSFEFKSVTNKGLIKELKIKEVKEFLIK